MSDSMANVISVEKVRAELQRLLATYTLEKEESEEAGDEHDIEYWDSACLTIEDVAAALGISLEEKQSEQRPHRPDSMTDLPTSDVKLTDEKNQKTASSAFPS